jgi:hypothetical protein
VLIYNTAEYLAFYVISPAVERQICHITVGEIDHGHRMDALERFKYWSVITIFYPYSQNVRSLSLFLKILGCPVCNKFPLVDNENPVACGFNFWQNMSAQNYSLLPAQFTY